MQKYLSLLLVLLSALISCAPGPARPDGMEYAQGFELPSPGTVVVKDLQSGRADTLRGPLHRLVCMSSSYVGFLEALDARETVAGVSGLAFLGDSLVQASAAEVGYDAALDYEAILRLQPDCVLAYAVGAVPPPYLGKLQELGVRTVILSEQLENHPLARAEYIKLFGALTGRQERADSLFAVVRDRYLSLVQPSAACKVLINIPYAEAWYIPGADNYMARLIRDAGGELLGALPGQRESRIIGLETAYAYACEADVWLNPGWCRSKAQLRSVHPLFASFPVLDKQVWNNTLQATPGGGNRFWETGPVRPDWVLEDLVNALGGAAPGTPMHYYIPLE